MKKIKQAVFLHENRRKVANGYTDMTTEERLSYGRNKRESYLARDKQKITKLKESKNVYLTNWELVMGLGS